MKRTAAVMAALVWTLPASAEFGTYQRHAISGYGYGGPGVLHWPGKFYSPAYGPGARGHGGGGHAGGHTKGGPSGGTHPGGGHHRPGQGKQGYGYKPHHKLPPSAKTVDSGWFQRPYPFHLDYYRMRYHGSYAPYFGNYNAPPTNFNVGPTFAPGFGVGLNPPFGAFGGHPGGVVGGGHTGGTLPGPSVP